MAVGTQVASLYAKISADSSAFGSAMSKMHNDMTLAQRSAVSLQNAVGAALKVAAGVGIAAVAGLTTSIGKSVKSAADMEQQIANIGAVMGLASGETEKLKTLIMDLGLDPNLKVSASEAADAIEMLGRNGLTMTQILDGAARSTVLLANATGADFATAADIATDVMAQFNIDAGHMNAAVDGITGVITNSKFSINDYRLAIAQAGGVAGSVGVTFDDFNAVIAAISPNFASGSDAGTSFKTFLQRLNPQSKEAGDLMRVLGIVTADGANQFFTASGQMKSMGEIAGVLNAAFGGLSEQQKLQAASTLFGTDAMRAAFGLAKAGQWEIDRLKQIIGNVSAEDAAAARMNTLSGTWEILRGIMETVVLQIGDRFLPVARKIVEWASELATKYGPQVVAWYGELARRIEIAFERVKAFRVDNDRLFETLNRVLQVGGLLLGALTRLIQPLIDLIARNVTWRDILIALGAIIASVVIPALVSMLAPFAAISAAVLAVGLVIARLRWEWENNIGGIRDFTNSALKKVENWLKEHTSVWRGTWGDTLRNLATSQTGLRAFYNEIYAYAFHYVQDAIMAFNRWRISWTATLTELKNEAIHRVSSMVTDVKLKVEWWIGELERKGEYIYWAIYTPLKRLYNESIIKWNELTRDVQAIWTRFTDWFKDTTVGKWVQYGADLIQGFWNGFKTKWDAFRQWAVTQWENFKNAFKSFFGIHSPSTLFQSFGESIGEGLALGLAQGMTAANTTLSSSAATLLGNLNNIKNQVSTTIGGITSAASNFGGGAAPPSAFTQGPSDMPNLSNSFSGWIASMQQFSQLPAPFHYSGMNAMSIAGSVLNDVKQFANTIATTYGGAITGAGGNWQNISAPLSTLQAATLDTPANQLVTAVYSLIAALQQHAQYDPQGAYAQQVFNLNMAPGVSGHAQQDLRNLITYLNALYPGG